MSGKTSIQWSDRVWNPTVGCTRVSSGCDHCYAFELHDQRHIAWKRGRWPSAPAQYHQPFSRVQMLPERLEDPLHWRKPQRIFVNSMSDLFHPDVPFDFIDRVFDVMLRAEQHTFQILTKRPDRMREYIREKAAHTVTARWFNAPQWVPDNIWLGVSVENQQAADERIPLLLETPAAVRFLSCEPLLGSVDLAPWLTLGWICELCHRRIHDQRLPDDWTLVLQSAVCPACRARVRAEGGMLMNARGGMYATTPDPRPFTPGISWVIIGGESGKHARVLIPDWADALIDQCRAAGVAVFMKQLGSELAYYFSLKDRHGGDMDEWPPDLKALRVREFPAVTPAVRRATVAP